MEKKPVKEIYKLIGGKIIGDQNFLVSSVSPIDKIKEQSIVFVRAKKYIHYPFPFNILLIVSKKIFPFIKNMPRSIIVVDNIDNAYITLLNELYPSTYPKGISEYAFISKNVAIGKDVYIGEGVIIGKDSVIEDNVKIFPGTYIGENIKIGANTIIYPHVVIFNNVQIGKNCVIQSGSVLGGEGFGYAQIDNVYRKIPQIGRLIIEDDVEVGALSVIDKGALSDTIIKKGVKIDSLVKIAHNVVVGENSVIAAQVGIAGSTKLGKNVMMGGQAGIKDHIAVGDNVIIGADSGVVTDLPSNVFVSGSPAVEHIKEYKAKVLMYKLPDLMREFKELKKEVKKLKKEIEKNEDA